MGPYTTPLTTMVRAQEQLLAASQRAVERQRAAVQAGAEGVRATQQAGIEVARATTKLTVPEGDAVDEPFDELREHHDAVFDEYLSLFDTVVDADEAAVDQAEEAVQRAAVASETAEAATETTARAAQTAVAETAAAGDGADDRLERFRAELEAEFEGVGETYAERLTAAGFDTVSALAAGGAEEVAAAADVSRSQAEAWVEQADDRQRELESEFEGVGETYADRLADAGIETETQLADADTAAVAAAADVSRSRAEEWIDRAG